MNRSVLSAPAAAALALLAAFAGPAFGEVYYDGAEPRTVTLQADLIADVGPAAGPGSVRALAAGAVPVAGVGDSLVRIYRVPRPAAGARSAGTAAAAAAPAGLPVYREGDSPAGRLMALPGGVLVKFRPDWTRGRIDAWLAQRSLAAERKLAMAGNWFFVPTPPGETSLRTANALHGSGEVLAATPNWWKQTVTR